MNRYRIRIAALFISLISSSALAAAEVVLTMDDLPHQPVDGLVHPSGVTFGFLYNGLPSTLANYNAGGPGTATYVKDPSIEGPADSVLSVSFPVPTPLVRFGVARTMGSTQFGATVQLFDDADNSLGTSNVVMTQEAPFLLEGQFNYSGAAVKRMTVGFPTALGGGGSIRFAFDNLAFIAVPEPGATSLLITGVVCVLRIRRRQRPECVPNRFSKKKPR